MRVSPRTRNLALAGFIVLSLVLLGVGLYGLLSSGSSSSFIEPTYSAAAAGKIAFVSDRDGHPQVYVMGADGTNQTNLSKETAKDADPSWSPDGKRIAFQSFRATHSDVFTMNADGSGATQLTNDDALDGQPRWSPDGSRLAYYSFAEPTQGSLWVMDASGANGAPLLDGNAGNKSCAGGFPGGWLPDGRHIIFRGGASASQVCAIGDDGSGLEVIFGDTQTNSLFPSPSPDGTRIAFSYNGEGDYNIYTMGTDGENLRRVTNGHWIDSEPVWSPDGQWLAFESNRDGGKNHIYICRPNGQELHKLTSGDYNDTSPSWTR